MKQIRLVVVMLSAFWSTVLSTEEPESTTVIKPEIQRYSYEAMPKDPLASLFFSATFPGLGQLYNREYTRGAVTMVTFWGSSLVIRALVNRWQRLNTDTFYVQDYFNEEIIHPVYTLKPENQQVGLPRAGKAVLGAAAVAWVGSYIFGLYDSYQGAKRFNRKLVARATVTPSVYFSLGVTKHEAGVRLSF